MALKKTFTDVISFDKTRPCFWSHFTLKQQQQQTEVNKS